MKYVVFSFDDGGSDSYDLAFPILENYSLKGVFNIITGCIDNTIPINHPYVTYEMCRKMQAKGHEIALHSDTHIRSINAEDFLSCYQKAKKELGDHEYSMAMPFNQLPNNSVIDFARKNKINSISVGLNKKQNLYFKNKLYSFLSFFSKKYLYVVKNAPFIQNVNIFTKENEPIIVNRIGAYSGTKPSYIYKLIKSTPKGSVIVIMFHSIVVKDESKAPWPDGAWTVKKFKKICSLISKNKNICNLTMRELFHLNRGTLNV